MPRNTLLLSALNPHWDGVLQGDDIIPALQQHMREYVQKAGREADVPPGAEAGSPGGTTVDDTAASAAAAATSAPAPAAEAALDRSSAAESAAAGASAATVDEQPSLEAAARDGGSGATAAAGPASATAKRKKQRKGAKGSQSPVGMPAPAPGVSTGSPAATDAPTSARDATTAIEIWAALSSDGKKAAVEDTMQLFDWVTAEGLAHSLPPAEFKARLESFANAIRGVPREVAPTLHTLDESYFACQLILSCPMRYSKSPFELSCGPWL